MGNENQGPPRGSELKWLSHAAGGCALPAENLGERRTRRSRRRRKRYERHPHPLVVSLSTHPLTVLLSTYFSDIFLLPYPLFPAARQLPVFLFFNPFLLLSASSSRSFSRRPIRRLIDTDIRSLAELSERFYIRALVIYSYARRKEPSSKVE